MKRSELVTRIEEYLLHTEHLDIPCSLGSDFKAAAEELVVLIEKAGMIPPKTKALLSDFYSGFSQEFLDEHQFTVNRWETEDE
jgi:hypothetical protein